MEYDHKDKYSTKHYLCSCDCGGSKIANIQSLKAGKTTSCGCALKNPRPGSRKYNEFRIHPNFVRVKASNVDEYFLCDLDDWERFKNSLFYIGKRGYVVFGSNRRYLHRKIMNTPDDLVVDHINGNPLDNRKSNLRNCRRIENMYNLKTPITNTSGHKGVWRDTHCQKWCAEIRYEKKKYWLGRFERIEDAVKAREDAEIKYFGEFRRISKNKEAV